MKSSKMGRPALVQKRDKLTSSISRENDQKQSKNLNLMDFSSYIQTMYALNMENSLKMVFLIKNSIETGILETNKELKSWFSLIDSKNLSKFYYKKFS